MTPATASAATRLPVTAPEDIAPADLAAALRRGALPAAPMAMPVQPLDGHLRTLLARGTAQLPLRTGH
jgi:hypothetical protein